MDKDFYKVLAATGVALEDLSKEERLLTDKAARALRSAGRYIKAYGRLYNYTRARVRYFNKHNPLLGAGGNGLASGEKVEGLKELIKEKAPEYFTITEGAPALKEAGLFDAIAGGVHLLTVYFAGIKTPDDLTGARLVEFLESYPYGWEPGGLYAGQMRDILEDCATIKELISGALYSNARGYYEALRALYSNI